MKLKYWILFLVTLSALVSSSAFATHSILIDYGPILVLPRDIARIKEIHEGVRGCIVDQLVIIAKAGFLERADFAIRFGDRRYPGLWTEKGRVTLVLGHMCGLVSAMEIEDEIKKTEDSRAADRQFERFMRQIAEELQTR